MSRVNYSRLYDVYQFIVVGHEMIGKTSIINRYFDDIFLQDLTRTFAIDFRSKHIEIDKSTEVIIRMWDTAGQERFDAISQNYYSKGDCIFLCFSIYDRKSFEKLEYYIDNIYRYANENRIIILVGTHADKSSERVINMNEIKDFAYENNLEYMEVSSKTGIGITELFKRSIKLIYDKRTISQDIRKEVYDKLIKKENFDKDNSNSKMYTCCTLQ
jgi:small GTP-binding protein